MQGSNGMNNFRPNQMLPYNQNGINGQGQQQQGQQGLNMNNQQQQQGNNQPQATDGGPRVNYAIDYPVSNQNLRRSSTFQTSLNNGQFNMAM